MRWPVLRGLIPGRAASTLVVAGLIGAGFSFAAISRTVATGTILLTAVLFAVVVEAAMRRRDQAVRDSRRLAEANTELESALAAVEEAEKSFRRLFDDHPNPMWVHDAETLQFLAVNHAAVARYGYSRAEFLAMGIVDILPAEDVPLVMGVIGQKSPTMLHTGPWRHRLKDGRVIWVEVTSHEPEFAGRRARLTLARDVTDRVGLEEQLRHQAFHDPLTNLPNRALLSDRLDHAIARARRQSERCAVLLLDLDDFKGINDSRGHGAGDALLVEVAYRVVAALRESDTAARLGGDEFAVLIEDAEDLGAVIAAAERLIDELSLPYEIEGHRIHTSVSIGIALGEGDSVSTIDLLRNADVAMYAAKAGGKNRWEIYERSRHFGVSDGLALQNELPRAIVEGELAVVYQPQFDLRTRTIVGVEALVRWNHPERGLVTPDVFIPLAERTSLINQIDEWVLETSCRQVQRWKEAGLPPLRVAVNVSGRFLEDDDRLVTAVARTLETTGIRPSDVEIELTESVAVAQHERALAILRRLRQLRVQVAIDDFGTGYSAFARLRSFPPDRIKIDREFIAGVDHDPNDAALVSAMIAMGHGIGLSVLAEGVETEAELEFLAAQGCDEVQGYLISRPLSVEALEDLLRHPERIRAFAAATPPASLPAAG
jgi:diguanylate cyclase (GGDEF)-like protein/PAS domain S-box-containing protein